MSARTRPPAAAVRDPALETALADTLGGGSCRGAPQRSSPRRTIDVVGYGPVGSRSAPPAATGLAAPAIYAYRRVGSTMEVAHELVAQGAPDGTLVFAARQEQGRGRLGRTWVSPEGGAYCSIILRPSPGTPGVGEEVPEPQVTGRPKEFPRNIPQLSLLAGLATAEAIRELTGLSPSIRWPNDVLIDGLKVAGILVEARNNAVVIGIGINVTTDPADLPPSSTSLKKCQPAPATTVVGGPGTLFPLQEVSDTSVVAVTVELYRRFLAWYDVWRRSGFIPIREALRPLMGLFGEPIQVSTASEQLRGVASDLDEQGRLVVRLDSGLSRAFDVGEVALLRARA